MSRLQKPSEGGGRGELGAVAAGHQATADAAVEILQRGGNAVDAAVAGAFAAMIAEPVLTGLFGAGLMTVRTPGRRAHVLDFFASVPGLGAAISPDDLDFFSVSIDFGPTRQEFHIGRGSAAVPGTLTGLFDAHRRWGSLPMEAIVEPARRLAVDGVALTEQMGYVFHLLDPILNHTQEVAAHYAPGSRPLRAGQPFVNEELADLLGRLAREGLEGATARDLQLAILDTFGPAQGGLISERDLAAARPELRPPLRRAYRSATVFMPPPPSLGGALVALGLELLAATELKAGGFSSAEQLLRLAEIQASMSEARREDPAVFLSDAALRAIETAVKASLARITAQGSTTHISVVDRQGLAVGITHTNGEGCGIAVPGTGVMMNNFLGEEDINPGGFHRGTPGQRMTTMTCPTVIERGDELWVLGSGGSNRIRSAILQVVHNLVSLGMSPQEAVSDSRIHVEGGILNIETPGRPPELVERLRRAFSETVVFDRPNMFFGGVHLVKSGPDGFSGGGDQRRGGVVRVV